MNGAQNVSSPSRAGPSHVVARAQTSNPPPPRGEVDPPARVAQRRIGWGDFRSLRIICVAALIALVFASPALAERGKLLERLTPEVMAVVYPGAERLGPEEGEP